ncbi:serine/arginine-rich splicing factor SC35-like [Tasmannia lanceolata]|uniref:serine/arginine-rich splicing factor SC35-like n=1 Tax=Tasmannia lanceolata TaxID=3420 RepID=UPI00406387E9
MSHFGRAGPPDIRDTFSLLVLNITFRTTADDLFPLFDKYGKVVDIFLPRDRRTGDPRGFAFVRYKYAEEAQKAVEKLDGRNVDGRNIMVQFAKYGPNAEAIKKGRIIEDFPKTKGGRSSSRSPPPRYRNDYRGRDYRKRSRSRSRDRYDRDRYHGRERDYRRRSRSRSVSPDYYKGRSRGKLDEKPRRSRSLSYDSRSPARRSLSPRRSVSPRRTPPSRNGSPGRHSSDELPPRPRIVSPRGRHANSRSVSPPNSNDD